MRMWGKHGSSSPHLHSSVGVGGSEGSRQILGGVNLGPGSHKTRSPQHGQDLQSPVPTSQRGGDASPTAPAGPGDGGLSPPVPSLCDALGHPNPWHLQGSTRAPGFIPSMARPPPPHSTGSSSPGSARILVQLL